MAEKSSEAKKPNYVKKVNGKEKQVGFEFHIDVKTIFLVFLLFFIIYTTYSAMDKETRRIAPEKSLTTIIKEISQGKVDKIEVSENKLKVFYKDIDKGGKPKQATAVRDISESLSKTLKDYGVDPNEVEIVYKDNQMVGNLVGIFFNAVLPVIVIIMIFAFIMRQAKGVQESMFNFGQSKAKRFNKKASNIKFADVAGVDEAKKELEEVVDFLKNSQRYQKLGARTPKGIMLIGPPGCGKTLLAKAVAGESNVPFYSIAGSEFMEMFVGVGPARVRDLFATAKKNAPAIVFIDEIDAIGQSRSGPSIQGRDEQRQTLNQILVEMDGFTPNEQIIVMAATNTVELLDPALLRSGRFDRRITVDYPDMEGRKAIMSIHSKGKPWAAEVDWNRVAQRTVGFSGADLESMLNEAAITAARYDHKEILMEDIEEAATKVKYGPAKKRLMTDEERRLTAYHEAGHAVVAYFLPHADPVHRISIISRGMALGYTMIHPDKDRIHETRPHLIDRIITTMGGRAAEELIFHEVTAGAANDFIQATRIARLMVTRLGMSRLGNVAYDNLSDVMELYGGGEQYIPSQETRTLIDKEISKIIEECYAEAKRILQKHQDKLDLVAKALLEKENLDKDEFEQILKQD